MTRDKIKEGDICTLDESVEYSYNPHKPYEVVVLWHGVNSQPLVTKLDAYKPFWTTYSQLIEVKRHIDLSIKALEQQTCEDAVSREAVLDIFADNVDATRPYSTVWEKIRDLPSVNPQPKWIPVSERLPEDYELVLFSTKTDRVFEGRYFDDNTDRQWYAFRDETFAWNNVVTAWMPLPKPYEPQESEE